MPSRTTRLRSAGAAGVLLAVTFGIPVLLVAIAGWPLPRQVPDWDRVATAVRQGDIPATVVIDTLALIVWIAWAQLVWALGWELGVNLRRTHAGRPARPAPAVPSIVTAGMARLVAVMLSVGLTIATTPKPALGAPRPVATVPVKTPVAVAVADNPTPARVTASWSVTAPDTLWDIAERTLGDGSRAGEILELNPNLRSARDLRAGQLLRLPDDANLPADHSIPTPPTQTATTADATPPSDTFTPATTITVRRGDNLWNLSATRLRSATGEQPAPQATLDYLHEVIAANTATIENPNLIYPGERVAFPAIGTPPSPSAPAVPSAAPVGQGPELPSPPPPPLASTAAPTTIPAAVAADPTRAPTHEPRPAVIETTSSGQHDGHGSPDPWIAGVAGATVLASGLLLTRRRLRNRAAAAGARQLRRRPSGPAAELQRAFVAASDLSLIRWANHELAVLAAQLKPARVTTYPVAIEVSPDDGLELLWSAPNPTAPAPWEVFDGGWAWRLCYDPDLPVPARPDPAVIPGLVTIGERDGNTLLIDLEAFGSLGLTGDPTRSTDLARSIITELAYGGDLANSYVHLVDLELAHLEHSDRARHRVDDDALDLLGRVAADHDRILDQQQLQHTFQLRLDGAAVGRELTVVAASADRLEDPADMVAAARPQRGVALIVLGGSADAGATIDVACDGRATLQPLGLTFQACAFPADVASEVADLLADAANIHDDRVPDLEPLTPTGGRRRPSTVTANTDVEDLDATTDLTDDNHHPDRPEPQLLVRVLGVPAIDGIAGLGRIEANLVTFLACSGGHATENQIIDAVWNGRAIERSTLWNRISKARSVLGPFIPARDQGSNVVRLATGVATDAQLLQMALDGAPELSTAQALDDLVAALELVRGVPFDAVGYDWAHEQQHYADACELVERATLTVVDLALDLEDIDAARHAVSQGLKALRVNEPLYRARMRIEAHCGNNTGVRAAYDELSILLEELSDGADTYTPAPITTALRDALLQSRRQSA